MPRRGPLLGVLSLVFAIASTQAVMAQSDDESIFDPLNPDAEESPRSPHAPEPAPQPTLAEEQNDAIDDDEESIVDPLNSPVDTAPAPTDAAPAAGDDQDEEILFDPLNATPPPPSNEPAPSARTGGAPAPPPRPVSRRLGFFTGRYVSRIAADLVHDNSHEDVFEWRNALRLGVRFDPSDTSTVVLEGRATHRFTVERGSTSRGEGFFSDADGQFEPELREAFVRWNLGDVSLTLGNQFSLWGVMDLVSPAQVIHPRDLRQGVSADGTEGLVPVWALDVRWFAADWLTLEAILVPFFTAERGTFIGHDVSLLSPGSTLATRLAIAETLDRIVDDGFGEAFAAASQHAGTPDALPQNLTGGVRLAASLGGVDLGLGYFYGWDPTPVLKLDPDLAVVVDAALRTPSVLRDLDPTPLLTDPRLGAALLRLQQRIAAGTRGDDLYEVDYRRNHNLAVDAVTYAGPIGLRGELVFAPARTVLVHRNPDHGGLFDDSGTTSLQTRRLPVLDAVIGLSWESSDTRWVVIGEGFYRATFGLEEHERPIPGEPHSGGLALALQATPVDDWGLTLATIWNASAPHDVVISARTSYAVASGVELFLEAAIFEGAALDQDLTLAGLLDHADEIALGLEWMF